MEIALDRTDSLPTFKHLAEEVEAAARGETGLREPVRMLGVVANVTAGRRDPSQIAALQGHFARLIRRLERVHSGSSDAAVLSDLIEGLLASLEEAETAALMELHARERESEVRRLRERVLDLLRSAGSHRPGQLVSALGCDPSQISRALRELEGSRLIAPVTAPAGGDRRARWYAAVDPKGAPTGKESRPKKPSQAPRRYALPSLEYQLLARTFTRRSTTFAELRSLTSEQAGELRRTIDALKTLGLLDEQSDQALTLTEAGTRELLSLFDEGFEATVEAVDDLVPPDFAGAVALAGAPGSGKRAIAREFASRRGWPHASIGSYIREQAFADGARDEPSVRAFGESLIAECGWGTILSRVIESAGATPGEQAVVVDGFRYPEGLNAFEELYSSVTAVFVDAPEWLRELRLHQERESGFKPDESWLSSLDASKLKADFPFVLSAPEATMEVAHR
jgi:adenylate kinase family enzyme